MNLLYNYFDTEFYILQRALIKNRYATGVLLTYYFQFFFIPCNFSVLQLTNTEIE